MGNAPHHLAADEGPRRRRAVRAVLHLLAVLAGSVLGGPVAPAGAQVATTTSTIAGAPAPPPITDDARGRLSGLDGGVPGPSAAATAPTTVAPGGAAGDDRPTPTTTTAPAAGTTVPAVTADPGGTDPAAGASPTTALSAPGEQAGSRVQADGRPTSVTAKGTSAPVALLITVAVGAGLSAIAARWFTHRPT